jgi:carboxypeptidase C (cathepsin A)
MFYFFFESRGNNKKDDPVVVWLTGGPGCSSELAVFYENGPFTIANNMSLAWNKFGWDTVCDYFKPHNLAMDPWCRSCYFVINTNFCR